MRWIWYVPTSLLAPTTTNVAHKCIILQQAAASAWEDSLHVLQEMLLLQQQQQAQQVYHSQAEQQVFQHPYPHDRSGSTTQSSLYNTRKFPGESELLSLLQLPRNASSSLPNTGGSGYTSNTRGKGPLYSTSVISGPLNTGDFHDGRGLSHLSSLHSQQMHTSPQSAGSFFHTLPRSDTQAGSNSTRQAPILVDLEQERDELDGKTSTSPFGSKRDNVVAVGKGEPRGVNHFATERQRREFLNEKYQTLRSLVPNPTKVWHD